MTNQSELEQILDGMYHAAHTDGLNDVFRPAPKVDQYKKLITANYTPNSEVEQLKASIAQTVKRVSDILMPPGSTFTDGESRFIIKKFRTLLERGMEDE